MVGDARRERGRLLAEDGRIKHLDGGLWFVPSSTAGGYIVDVVASTCTCPDHAKLPAGMKGFLAVAKRWVSERTFSWGINCQRLGKDYERTVASSEAMFWASQIRVLIRRPATA